jgi:hypothetical protein
MRRRASSSLGERPMPQFGQLCGREGAKGTGAVEEVVLEIEGGGRVVVRDMEGVRYSA